MDIDWHGLDEWTEGKPLRILQMDPYDRVVLRIAEERDAVQKRTFTKWVNASLEKAGRHVIDLYQDFRDGCNLIVLLEVLSGRVLPRERGKMQLHKIQNVETVLNFLRHRGVKLVNIRAEDIVNGNAKLTLGLVWTLMKAATEEANPIKRYT